MINKLIYLTFLLIMITFIMWKFNNYMLNFLIIMEYFVLTMIILMLLNNLNDWIFMIYMIFSVCEAVIGLSLLVSMNFNFGHQNLNMMNLCVN